MTDLRQGRLRRSLSETFFSPSLHQTPMLQEGVSDHGHQGVTVEAAPGAPLEVVEAELLLHLLMGLLAHPARLDGGRQLSQRNPGRQVGQIVFALARRPPLAHEPGFLPRHVLLALVKDVLRRPQGNRI